MIDLIWLSSAVIRSSDEAESGHSHMTLYLHGFDCRFYESLWASSLISYATMGWLESQFALIHTVIDLIWGSSAVIGSSDEAASWKIENMTLFLHEFD